MVTRAVRRQLMRAISQRALRPRARDNASMTREPGRTQCDAPCNNAMLCAREENKRQCMTCVTSPVSVCKMDTCILHCTEKLLEAFATVSLSLPPHPRFFTFPSASPAQSTALYSVCVSFLFSGAGEVLQTALFEMVNSML